MDNLELLVKGTPDWHNIINNNFSAVESSISNLDMGQASSTIVVATSQSRNKEKADYVVASGAIDAQETIMNAIRSLPYGQGGKVILLEGTYTVNKGIFCSDDNVTIEGVGGSTIIKADNSFNTSSGLARGDMFTNGNNENHNLVFRDLIIDCNELANGFSYFQTSDSLIENVLILNPRYSGIELGACSNFKIIGNTISNNKVIDNTGIRIGIQPNRNLLIYGNTFSNLEEGIKLSLVSETIINNNLVINNSNYGINMSYNTFDNVIINNMLVRNGFAQVGYAGHIYISDASAEYNMIQGNTFRQGGNTSGDGATNGVAIKSGSKGNMIINNDMYTWGWGSAIMDSGTGTVTTSGNRGI